MKESRAIIQRVGRVNSFHQYIDLAIEDEALRKIHPGESLLVRFRDDDPDTEQWDPYLREQWWVQGFTKDGLLRTEQPFSQRYQPQQIVSVLGPVGLPYRFRKSLRNVLLVAYDTAPTPLTAMISQLLGNNISVTMVLLGEARRYDTAHLPPEIEVIHGDGKLNWQNRVMTLGWADQIFVVASQDDELSRFAEFMRIVEEMRTDVPKNYVFGVFQPLQPCGVGACSACMLRVDRDLVPVCTQGPSFDLTLVKLPR